LTAACKGGGAECTLIEMDVKLKNAEKTNKLYSMVHHEPNGETTTAVNFAATSLSEDAYSMHEAQIENVIIIA